MASGAFISVAIDRSSRTPYFMQIYQQLRGAITSGRVKSSSRLPSTRRFARELGVSRSTIVVAYDHLISEGLAEGKQGSAVYAVGDAARSSEAPNPALHPQVAESGWRPLCPDHVPMDLFPSKIWARSVGRVAREMGNTIAADVPPFGDIRLREQVAQHLFERRGLQVSPEQVVITSSSADAIRSLLRTLAVKGDNIAIQNPAAMMTYRYAAALGLSPSWLDISEADSLSRLAGYAPRLMVVESSLSAPISGPLVESSRVALLELAERQQSWIIEDDSDFELQSIGATASLAQSGSQRVISIGSFSRVLSHGLGLGYMVLPRSTIHFMTNDIKTFDQRASLMQQRPLAEMMVDGSFDQYLRGIRVAYLDRRNALVASLRHAIGDLVDIPRQRASSRIAVCLPGGIDDTAVALSAHSMGLFCRPLSLCCSGRTPLSGLLMGACGVVNEALKEKLADLRDLLLQRLSIADDSTGGNSEIRPLKYLGQPHYGGAMFNQSKLGHETWRRV